MDTDQLEHDMNELCHEWMHGKPPTDGVFGPVQAAARVFIFQCLSAWTGLEATGQTEELAPDFESWLHKILEDESPYVRNIASVKAETALNIVSPQPARPAGYRSLPWGAAEPSGSSAGPPGPSDRGSDSACG